MINPPHRSDVVVTVDRRTEQTMRAWMDEVTLEVNNLLSSGGGGGGASDHGALTGLSDDDHSQYLNNTRGDARYYTQSQLNAGQLNTLYYTETEVNSLLSGKANTSHTHALANVSDVTMTAANLNSLDDGANSTLHFHDSDRSRANHTGTQTASTISDFSEAVDDRVNALLVEGANITLTYNDGANTLTIDAASGGLLTEAEINFGSDPVRSKKFTIVDASVTPTSKVTVMPSGNVGTGRVGDDWEWDSIAFAAKAGSGSFTITAFASGRIMGNRKVYYSVG